MPKKQKLREELAETGVLKDGAGNEIARLSLTGELIINRHAFYEIIAKEAYQHAQRVTYQYIYKMFGKTGKIFPDKEVKAVLDEMIQRKFLYRGAQYVIVLAGYRLNEDAYPPYVTQREAVAGLEPIEDE